MEQAKTHAASRVFPAARAYLTNSATVVLCLAGRNVTAGKPLQLDQASACVHAKCHMLLWLQAAPLVECH